MICREGVVTKTIVQLWKYSYKYKHCLVMLLLFVCLGAYLQILIPQYMAAVLDGVLNEKPLDYIARACGVTGGLSLVLVVQGIGEGYFVSRWSAGVTKNLTDQLFRRILSFESTDMDHFGQATTLTRLTTDASNLRRALQMIHSLLMCPLLVVFSWISAFRISKDLSKVFLMVIPVLAVILVFIIARSRIYYRKMLIHYDEMNQCLSENIRGMRTVKSYAREDEQETLFNNIAGNLMHSSLSAERLAVLNNPFSKMAINMSVLALTWLGGRRIIEGVLSVGDLFCLISYANQILYQILIISMILVPLITSRICLERIIEMVEWKDKPVDIRDLQEDKTTEKDHAFNNSSDAIPEISIKNLCFSYPSDGTLSDLLKDINVDIYAGELIGITGTGGAGKTTLVKLIMGLYKPTSGTVYIRGKQVFSYKSDNRMKLFGYVPQKPQLFTGTIKENLVFGIPEPGREELDKASENACIDEYIKNQSDGYESLITEGGKNLSGGQRQRMCLARALLRDAPILILDNMTSALDRITEEKVVRKLKEEYTDKTRIVISDRISTIKNSDRIIVMNRGRIEGIGTHEELLQSCNLYKVIAETQKGQIDD